MTEGDRLRAILGARDAGPDSDGETVFEAAERVVRERDGAIAYAKSEMVRLTAEAVGRAAGEAKAKMDAMALDRMPSAVLRSVYDGYAEVDWHLEPDETEP